MDASEIQRISSSIDRNSSSVWRRNTPDVFSRSVRDEDDEEALKWAAIEKLPTYNRVRKGILTTPAGEWREVDIEKLSYQEKKNLLDRLIRIADEDNEKFLLKMKNRIEIVGINFPTIEVRFEHLKVDSTVYVGSKGIPTVLNFMVNQVEGLLNNLKILPNRKKPFTILEDISGIIKPSRLTLLLGPPGSGKTTLLLALAGKLSKDLKVSGKVTYNGHEMNEFVPQRTAAYISQHDLHLGEMTVRETLTFSARCQGVGTGYEMLVELSRREKEANIKPDPDIDVFMKAVAMAGQESSVFTEYIIKILGLDICADTMVGDEMRRGISGGQRKRVTTGEMLVGPARALFMDEISTGLDSSTTFQIIKSMSQSIHILNGTAVISLLQPAPETYELFDDIILLSEGRIVYQGPREHVLEFFESMGFKCPERKGVADFLQEVTSKKDQEQYWMNKDEPYGYITVKEFTDAFQSFHVGRKLGEELSTPFDKSKSHPAALTSSKYGINNKELLRACADREFLLMKRNSFANIFRMIQLVGLCSITMTVFIRSNLHHRTIDDGGIYLGFLFATLNVVMFNGFSDLTFTVIKLPVFYKQRDLLFFPAWAYALPSWILRIPISFVESGIWVFLSYYVVGLDPYVGRLFKQYLLCVILGQAATALFKLVASLGRNMLIANTYGTFVLGILQTLGGFVLSRVDVKVWWKWGYWISPMTYAQNGLSVNEFLGDKWKHILPGTNQTLGYLVLKTRGIFPHGYWYWISIAALLGHIIVFNIGYALGLTFLDPLVEHQVFVSEESWNERQTASSPRKAIEMSSTIESLAAASEENANTEGSTPATPTEGSNRNGNRKRGMILPFLPLSLTFDEIKYSVDMPQQMKDQGVEGDRLLLLKGLSGSFRPGILTALMGVSGAGKTTLMDVLAGRKTGGYIEGTISISGYHKKQETFARISGYCEQNDIHSPNVTVYESLVFSAWLRLSSEVDRATRMMFVEEIMELVELEPLRNAIVGLPGVDGLSTEQRKRLTIAVELVANPSIIFMDEPTSGLDARAAAIVMRTVRNTVDTGRTVVCTIHQPSIDIFEAFDELFLLKRGGEEIYVGPLGRHSCDLISYFEAVNGVAKIKDGYNPATWMLEVTAPAQEEALEVDFAAIYKNSELYRRNKALIGELSQPAPGSQDLHFPTQYAQPFIAQCMACLWKQHHSYWKNPSYTAVRLLFASFVAIIYGSIFWDIGTKTSKQQDLLNALGSMFSAILALGLVNTFTVQPVVAAERAVFYREKAAGMYSAFPYAFGQVIMEIPYVLAQTVMYGTIAYAMIGFDWEAKKFFWYIYFMFFTLLSFTYYGIMTIGLTPTQQIAAISSTALYAIWISFSGFMIPVKRLPKFWKWFYWICPMAWSLYGLIISQFRDVHDTLETGQEVVQYLRSYFGFKSSFLAACAIVVPSFAVVFAVIFAISIKILNFQRR